MSDWLKEDIIIVSHDVFHNVAVCRDEYVFKTKLKQFIVNWRLVQCVEYVGQRLLLGGQKCDYKMKKK